MKKLRPNVAAIVRNRAGEILVCERLKIAGAWQFPQGGVGKGETARQALERELIEEISLRPGDYRVVEERGPYGYEFGGGKTKKGYHGQEQRYFLVEVTAPKPRLDLATAKPEFRSARWIRPEQFDLAWLPEMKRKVYRAVLKDFFGVTK